MGTTRRPAVRIALFRGINVGGKNVLPMKELIGDLQSLGLDDVKTYIQSGNAVFRSPGNRSATLGDDIAAVIEKRHGFRPSVQILDLERFAQAMESNPFPEAEADPKTLHLFFLGSKPAAPDLGSLESARAMTERFHLTDRVFYLHAPDGIGRSRLAARAETLLGVPATGRNWRTVQKLWDIANRGQGEE